MFKRAYFDEVIFGYESGPGRHPNSNVHSRFVRMAHGCVMMKSLMGANKTRGICQTRAQQPELSLLITNGQALYALLRGIVPWHLKMCSFPVYTNLENIHLTHFSQPTLETAIMLGGFSPSVYDAGPASTQHRVNVSCSFSYYVITRHPWVKGWYLVHYTVAYIYTRHFRPQRASCLYVLFKKTFTIKNV